MLRDTGSDALKFHATFKDNITRGLKPFSDAIIKIFSDQFLSEWTKGAQSSAVWRKRAPKKSKAVRDRLTVRSGKMIASLGISGANSINRIERKGKTFRIVKGSKLVYPAILARRNPRWNPLGIALNAVMKNLQKIFDRAASQLKKRIFG